MVVNDAEVNAVAASSGAAVVTDRPFVDVDVCCLFQPQPLPLSRIVD